MTSGFTFEESKAEKDSLTISTRGVLPVQQLKWLVHNGMIKGISDYPIEADQFQPNSIDLRLGPVAYRVRCSFLPENESVEQKLQKLTQHSFSIENGAVLEPNCTYIIPLLEELDLPGTVTRPGTKKPNSEPAIFAEEHLAAKTNPKSSTGRLDIFTRVITDYSHRFEEIPSGYRGRLYLEVVPKSFSIGIKTGQKLNQLRIRHGVSYLSDQDILMAHKQQPILLDDQARPLPADRLKLGNGLFMSVSLKPERDNIVGYKARKHRDVIDLEKMNYYRIEDFWEPVYTRNEDFIILEPEAFYIFASREQCRIPAHLAAEMVPYDTGSGELRTHYAGFFDSGFGNDPDHPGAKAVLEVRSHDVPFLVEDGQTFFRMIFEPNTDIPEFVYGSAIKSHYQSQGLKLSKHFKNQ